MKDNKKLFISLAALSVIGLGVTMFINTSNPSNVITESNDSSTTIPSQNLVPKLDLKNVSNISGSVEVEGGCIETKENSCNDEALKHNIDGSEISKQDPFIKYDQDPKIKKPLEKNIVTTDSGETYDANQVSEPIKEGVEPKWNFAQVNTQAIKYGSSTATYHKCISCHGRNGMKEAFGKSKKLYEMTSEEIMTALTSYRDKKISRYGYGNIMHEQVKALTNEDFKSLINQIKSLDQTITEQVDSSVETKK